MEVTGRGESASRFFDDLTRFQGRVIATDAEGATVPFAAALGRFAEQAEQRRDTEARLYVIGNGGSAAIASHAAVDLWKNAGVQAVAMNDAAQLTAISNDYGYEEVFARPFKRFSRPMDVLVAISSSGQSPNILSCARLANELGNAVITMSGFASDNPLRTEGDLNFYVPSDRYGIVENIHLGIFHAIIEELKSTHESRETSS